MPFSDRRDAIQICTYVCYGSDVQLCHGLILCLPVCGLWSSLLLECPVCANGSVLLLSSPLLCVANDTAIIPVPDGICNPLAADDPSRYKVQGGFALL